MRRMKSVYPEFGDRVAFFAIGQDPSESLGKMEQYREREGHPWPVAKPDRNMLIDFRVFQQSTKIAVDAGGIITYRAGYGRGDPDTWRQVFRGLAKSVVR